jgi:hypothetical protein
MPIILAVMIYTVLVQCLKRRSAVMEKAMRHFLDRSFSGILIIKVMSTGMLLNKASEIYLCWHCEQSDANIIPYSVKWPCTKRL